MRRRDAGARLQSASNLVSTLALLLCRSEFVRGGSALPASSTPALSKLALQPLNRASEPANRVSSPGATVAALDPAATADSGSAVSFRGIGGISGGGATSALLRPYPPQQRDQILDLLFNKTFAAALPILKVEIGGDAQTTDGTEASHQHTRHEAPNFHRGYEWWLMKEAKKRNPDIILWGLPWAFPGWLDTTRSNNPYSNVSATAAYVVDWVDGARREHGLHIAMVGCWNERPFNTDYLKELRRQLDARNLSRTGIIADDGHSAGVLAVAMERDPELMAAVQAFGMHYPLMTSPPAAAAVSAKTGKPIFASEDYGVYFDSSGGKAWARLINQNFVRGGMSGTIAWNLVTSYYAPHPSASYGPCPSCNDALPYRLCGLMHAAWPWSGHYVPTPQLYVSAHTTQFVEVGWKYAAVGNGSGLLAKGGSYVTLVAPFKGSASAPDLSVVVEKMSHEGSTSAWAGLPAYETANESLTLQFGPSYAGRALALWKSLVPSAIVERGKDIMIPSVDTMLIRQDMPVYADATGTVTLQVCVDCMFTLTTLLGAGHKGGFGDGTDGPHIPLPSSFPLPFNSSFDQLEAGMEADYFIDQAGSWEAVPAAAAGGSGMAMRQMVEEKPICWAGDQAPITIAGSTNWSDVSVSVSVRLETPGGMPWIGARIQGRKGDPAPLGPLYAARQDTSRACDEEEFPIATKIQFKGLQGQGSNVTTEAACREACCAHDGCTLYQFWPSEPVSSRCWLGHKPTDGSGTHPGKFTSRSRVPLVTLPPRPKGGSTFTNAAGVLLAIDATTSRWLLAPCAACLHSNATLLGQGPLPSDSLHSLNNDDGPWAKLHLELHAMVASGWVGGHQLFSKIDVSAAPLKGFVGFGMGEFSAALFDDFAVTASPTSTTTASS